jgi:hypothetical protein
MGAETRRLLYALLERTGGRLDAIERRLQGLEGVAFAYDEIDERLARLEQRPPTPLGGRELQRQRAEQVLKVRAQGYSHPRTADAVGISKAGVRRILLRHGDPAPGRVRGINDKSYAAHGSQNGAGREAR